MLMKLSILILNLERLTVMKKIYIAMAVLAAAVMVSCEQEKSFGDLTPVGENEIAFVMQNAGTRSAEAGPEAIKGISIPMGEADGESFFLEETVEELNPSPATRGVPAYTFNLGTLYTSLGVYADGNFQDASFALMDAEMYDEHGWRYRHNYSGNPWPEDRDEDVHFFLRLPASPSGFVSPSYSSEKMSFSFTSPYTGVEQQDFLLGHTYISHNDHDGYLPNGAPVTMYHALTGVKFRVGNDNTGKTKTIITGVKFSNLYDKGVCEFNPSTGAVSWPASSLSMSLGTFTQTFTNATYDPNLQDLTQNPDGTVSYGEDSQYAGTSWTSAAAVNTFNLNDEDGSLTFWFIPQVLSDDVTLEVTFRVKTKDTPNGTEVKHTIEFGKRANNVEWKAGQLRTYTLEPRDVDVEIFDTMVGKSKTGLHVTNTGNVAEYVRMLVIGNWYGWESEEDQAAGKEPDILVGYKTDGSGGENDNEMADPWFREDHQFGQYFDNTFTDGKPLNGNKWIRGTTAFYYPDPIGPGTTLDSQSEALFKSYIWPENVPFPTIYIPDPESNVRKPAVGVHLIMEVAVQAIGTKKPDGTPYADCWEAWTAAVGSTIAPK